MSDQSNGRWFKVQASLIVRATDEEAAIDLVAEAVRKGYDSVKGVLLAAYQVVPPAHPHSDHVTDALDRKDR